VAGWEDAKEQGEVPHPTDMKPAPKALPRYTGMAGNKLSNHRRPDRAIAWAFAAHVALRADEPGRVSGEKKRGSMRGGEDLRDCTTARQNNCVVLLRILMPR
jgi:hypothetical protein